MWGGWECAGFSVGAKVLDVWLTVLWVPSGHPQANHWPAGQLPLAESLLHHTILTVSVLLIEGKGVEEVRIRERHRGQTGTGWRRREAIQPISVSQSQRGNSDVESDRLHVSTGSNLLQSILLLLTLLLRDEAKHL